jgi:hypothetical protein
MLTGLRYFERAIKGDNGGAAKVNYLKFPFRNFSLTFLSQLGLSSALTTFRREKSLLCCTCCDGALIFVVLSKRLLDLIAFYANTT